MNNQRANPKLRDEERRQKEVLAVLNEIDRSLMNLLDLPEIFFDEFRKFQDERGQRLKQERERSARLYQALESAVGPERAKAILAEIDLTLSHDADQLGSNH